MLIKYLAYLPGKGKTDSVCNLIKDNLKSNNSLKCIFVTPSKDLSNEVKSRLLSMGISEDIIHVVNSSTEESSVKSRIIDKRNNYNSKASIMVITSAAFLNLENINLDEDLLIMDETMNIHEVIKFDVASPMTEFFLEKYIEASKVTLSGKEFYELKLISQLNGDYFENELKKLDLVKFLLSSNKSVFVTKNDFESYLLNQSNSFNIHVITDFDYIKNCKEIISLGFDLNKTRMGLLHSKINNYVYQEIVSNDPTKYRYQNDIEILYFSDTDVGNYKIGLNPEIAMTITDEIKKLNLTDFTLTDFNSGKFKSKLSDNLVGAVSHGLNKPEWTSCDTSVILSNYRMSPEEASLYEYLDYNKDDMDRASDINIKIQIFTRNSIRTGMNNNKITLVVLDRRCALGIKSALPNCNIKISKLKSDVEELVKRTYKSDVRIVTISPKERRRINYLRDKKKNNPDKFTSKEQNELTKLVLKMNTKP